MEKIKITVVIPVLNEEHSIDALIKSMTEQTLLPTEVIVVDGGSTDSTIEKINSWKKLLKTKDAKSSFILKLIVQHGANRSVSRNLGINNSSTNLVALTDAGCVPKNDWLERLSNPFIEDPHTQVVAGFYDPAPQNWWEDLLANYTCTRSWNLDEEKFLPSSRSIAFTKIIWHQVHGYPEELNTCEDLVFAQKLKDTAKFWKVVSEAVVIWIQPKTVSELRRKIHDYALGDLEANYSRHVDKINSAFWRILILLFVAVPAVIIGQSYFRLFGLGLFLLYIGGSIAKQRSMFKYLFVPIIAPVVQLVVDTTLVQALIYHKLSAPYK